MRAVFRTHFVQPNDKVIGPLKIEMNPLKSEFQTFKGSMDLFSVAKKFINSQQQRIVWLSKNLQFPTELLYKVISVKVSLTIGDSVKVK